MNRVSLSIQDRDRLIEAVLAFGCLLILLRTLASTVYLVDSAEFSIGAAKLGIVHSPGYPLYLLIAHLFTGLPVGDVGFRVNLFSAVCLALTAPLVYALIRDLIDDRAVAVACALMLVWSYHVWATGVAAEIYAPQIMTLAVTGAALIALWRAGAASWSRVLPVGLLYGLAVAAAPSSGLFAPGLVITLLCLRVPLTRCMAAGAVAGAVFALCLLYFPLRAADPSTVILAGVYDAAGVLHPFPLDSIGGVFAFVSGQPFRYLFFQGGPLSPARIADFLALVWDNSLGFGVLVALFGLGLLYRRSRVMLTLWLIWFLPYTVFYSGYGAADRDMMFGPSLLLLTIPLAFGLRWFTLQAPPSARIAVAVVLPLIFLVANFSLVDLSQDTRIRGQSQAMMAALPPDALVFADWWQVMPLTYVQVIDGQRPDLTLYNDTLMPDDQLNALVHKMLNNADRPVVILSGAADRIDLTAYRHDDRFQAEPLHAGVAVDDGEPGITDATIFRRTR